MSKSGFLLDFRCSGCAHDFYDLLPAKLDESLVVLVQIEGDLSGGKAATSSDIES